MGLLTPGFNEFTFWGIVLYVVAFGVWILGGMFAATPIGKFMLKLANVVAIPMLIVGTILLFGVNFVINVFATTTGTVVALGILAIVLIGIMLFVLPKKDKVF